MCRSSGAIVWTADLRRRRADGKALGVECVVTVLLLVSIPNQSQQTKLSGGCTAGGSKMVPVTTAVHISHTSLSEPGERSRRLPQSAQKTRVPTADIVVCVRGGWVGVLGGVGRGLGGVCRVARVVGECSSGCCTFFWLARAEWQGCATGLCACLARVVSASTSTLTLTHHHHQINTPTFNPHSLSHFPSFRNSTCIQFPQSAPFNRRRDRQHT